MKEYITPEVEFVELEEVDIITNSSSCDGYVCPNQFGNTCTGNPYGGQ